MILQLCDQALRQIRMPSSTQLAPYAPYPEQLPLRLYEYWPFM
jgi:hypothetical protein